MSSWTAIKMRCVDILDNDTDLQALQNLEVYRAMPRSIDNGILPCVILAPRGELNFGWSGGNRHEANYVMQLRLYLTPVNTELTMQSEFATEEYFDALKDAFLSRPQLQYNNAGLVISGTKSVAGNILIRMVSGLTQPIEYPIGIRQSLFYGAIFELTIPIREVVAIKVRGT